jgi:hypothetical protein
LLDVLAMLTVLTVLTWLTMLTMLALLILSFASNLGRPLSSQCTAVVAAAATEERLSAR